MFEVGRRLSSIAKIPKQQDHESAENLFLNFFLSFVSLLIIMFSYLKYNIDLHNEISRKYIATLTCSPGTAFQNHTHNFKTNQTNFISLSTIIAKMIESTDTKNSKCVLSHFFVKKIYKDLNFHITLYFYGDVTPC